MPKACNSSHIFTPFKKLNVYWVWKMSKICPKLVYHWSERPQVVPSLQSKFLIFYRLFKNQRKKGINDFFCKTNVQAIVVIDVHNISIHFEALKKTFKFGLFWQSFATLISHLGVLLVKIREENLYSTNFLYFTH